MQSPCFHLCKSLAFPSSCHRNSFLGFQHALAPSSTQKLNIPSISKLNHESGRRIVMQKNRPNSNNRANKIGRTMLKGKKENVWSVDNEMAEKEGKKTERGRSRGGSKGRKVTKGKMGKIGKVMVSGAPLVEIETVLQTQEPVIRPFWSTFASSVSGIWKGVGAVFSPITAEMEPIDVGKKNEYLYDCYTLSRIQVLPSSSGKPASQIQRKIQWVTMNPSGETSDQTGSENAGPEESKHRIKKAADSVLPKFESFNMEASDVMEDDVMGDEPGLVFFEDGSYSRGPTSIPVGEMNESNYYLNPTFKFEQCLVKGCHIRLRVVHTIEFSGGGSEIQIMRIAVYEEQWVGPSDLSDDSDMELELKPFSQRKRTKVTELTGQWKVFEVSATPIYDDDTSNKTNRSDYVYLCTETLKKRSLPENLVSFGEEERIDMDDATVLWLPGGVTAYVDVKKDGVLCIGVGWYSDEGINLVMERDYGLDGLVKEVRSKSEVKRRWSDPLPL